jgi:hypothetical protein
LWAITHQNKVVFAFKIAHACVTNGCATQAADVFSVDPFGLFHTIILAKSQLNIN